VPDRLCKLITERAENCIIMSLGSGPDAHGQLLIYHDALALYPKFKPRMAKVFADAGAVIREGLNGYVKEVTEKTFPAPENWFGMPDAEYTALEELLNIANPVIFDADEEKPEKKKSKKNKKNK
jgi:ketopantoate hydroxymethyltransferase